MKMLTGCLTFLKKGAHGKKHSLMTLESAVIFYPEDVNHSRGAEFPPKKLTKHSPAELRTLRKTEEKKYVSVKRRQEVEGARDFYRVRAGEIGTRGETDITEVPFDQFAHANTIKITRVEELGSGIGNDVEPFAAPRYGITILGQTHTFGDGAATLGYVIWAEHRGILVDPPVDSAEHLRRLGVPSGAITTIILTKVRTDHDAGAFQRLFCETGVRNDYPRLRIRCCESTAHSRRPAPRSLSYWWSLYR